MWCIGRGWLTKLLNWNNFKNYSRKSYLNENGMETEEDVIELNWIRRTRILLLIHGEHSRWPEEETIVEGETDETGQIIAQVVEIKTDDGLATIVHNDLLMNFWCKTWRRKLMREQLPGDRRKPTTRRSKASQCLDPSRRVNASALPSKSVAPRHPVPRSGAGRPRWSIRRL